MTRWLRLVALGVPLVAWPGALDAQESVLATKHNLSVSGPGPIRATSETQVCIFCHVGHNGLPGGTNRPASNATYKPYNSSTLVSTPALPSGSTRVCLSCHDGTIALGQTVASGKIEMLQTAPGGKLPPGPTSLGTDLWRSHPVSFVPRAMGDVHAPTQGDVVKLDHSGRVQCTSCHDPHRNATAEGNFLVKSNRASQLCLSCHAETYWLTNPSAHQLSTALYGPTQGSTTSFLTVADNGCESCHTSHAAGTSSRLLRDLDPTICLQCHNGRVARLNIDADLLKPYSHPVLTADPTLHDEAEKPGNPKFALPEMQATASRHVVCSDCHNPHAAFEMSAVAPRTSGLLSGVWGIDGYGNRLDPALHEYEICFKCHGDSANQPQRLPRGPLQATPRLTLDVNLRRVFDPSAPSFHPIEGPGRSGTVPGLIAPLTTGSMIYCSDCHASDTGANAGGSGPRGPHGSSYRHILERNYSTTDNSVEGAFTYALCYKCHDRATLLDPKRSGFPLHMRHVVNDTTPCSACHDPHGVSALQGNPVNNAHLVNFDTSIVTANTLGQMTYVTTGPGRGSCSLSCHGYVHTGSRYDPTTR
jgi:predicted CXXCH cytochrome family protein